MKKIIYITLLILSQSANAYDFRGINLGDPCSTINDYELSQGSQRVGESGGTLNYSGTFLNNLVKITYFCKKGKFTRGVYLFKFTSFEQAKEFYLSNKQQIINTYGKPNTDGESKEYKAFHKEMNIELSEKEKYILSWKTDNVSITYSVLHPSVHSSNSAVGLNVQKI